MVLSRKTIFIFIQYITLIYLHYVSAETNEFLT